MKNPRPITDLEHNRQQIRRLSYTALLLAIMLALSYFESFLPSIAGPLPLRYGLANIPVMWAILQGNPLLALMLNLAKALLALMGRGGLNFLLSLAGGILSLCVMHAANRISQQRVSLVLVSCLGAVSHNLAQLGVLLIFFPQVGTGISYTLFPWLIILGIISGVLTAGILHVLGPYLIHVSRS